jgi:uncharacterized protein YdhG (YjbR/CyaY superfamily)
MSTNPISDYASSCIPKHRDVCELLQSELDAALPDAASKIWHAIPVWFIDENPIVGYKATAKHVNLLFWSGQAFNESGLAAAGKFKAAQVQFTEASQVDLKQLRRWLKKARTEIWDYKGLRQGKRARTQQGPQQQDAEG